MPSDNLLLISDAVIDSIEPHQPLSDDLIRKLLSVFPENIVLGALDIIDHQRVIKHTTPWSYSHYEVLGSTDKYSVFLDMTIAKIPFYCSCPAFAYVVLSSRSEIMCKHILAARLANNLSLFIEHPLTPDDIQTMVIERYSDIKMPNGLLNMKH